MILGFKQQFPDKTPTNFKEKILSGEKIHSIRAGYRWSLGMTIQMAYGVRTKNYNQFNKERSGLDQCLGLQMIDMCFKSGMLSIVVDGIYLGGESEFLLFKNDGLTATQFLNWFFPKGKGEFSGQIIHWTNFKY